MYGSVTDLVSRLQDDEMPKVSAECLKTASNSEQSHPEASRSSAEKQIIQ